MPPQDRSEARRPQRAEHRHLGIERRHHLRQLLEHRDGEPAVSEVLGHLEADEAAAHDDGARGLSLVDPREDPSCGGAAATQVSREERLGHRV
jgi:hypothetical protein